ncbi:MAG: uroporphyrinogen decarboxylase family protein [Anaerolineaceae bacterium]|nr:uroporphyrinogen decarboxylase family protein [Anaerolineaceae bacterium]
MNDLSPKQRVYARLARQPVDRIPNLCILMTFAARRIGCTYDQYVQDYPLLLEGNLRCCDEFEIDMLSAISDPMREAHDLGAKVVFPFDDVPYASEALIKTSQDLLALQPVQPDQGRRMSDRISAIRLFKEQVGETYPILGWVEGAFAEACDLHGITETMRDLVDQPEFLQDLMEICTQQAILFADAQVDAGADFIGIGDAAASLIGPRSYKKFALPYEQRIIQAVHARGAKARLHICGNISSLLKILPETGADIIDIDYPVDFESAVEALRPTTAANGNFEPSAILLQGKVDDVRAAVQGCVSVSDTNTFIAAGCEVPRDTPPENLREVTRTLWDFSPNKLL